MCSEQQDFVVGKSLQFLKLLPVIAEEDSDDEEEIILDSDSEKDKDLPNQELMKPIIKKTHPEVAKKSVTQSINQW